MALNTNEYFYETIYNLLHPYTDYFEILDEFDTDTRDYAYIFIGDEKIEGWYSEDPRRTLEKGVCEFHVYLGTQSKDELRNKMGNLLEIGRLIFHKPANPTEFTYTYDGTDQYDIFITEIYAKEIYKILDEMDHVSHLNIIGEIKYTKRSA